MSLPIKLIQNGIITKVSCAFDIDIQGSDAQLSVSYDAHSRLIDEHQFPAFLVKHMSSDGSEPYTLVESLFDLLVRGLHNPKSLKLKVKINKNPSNTVVIEFVFKQQRKRKNKEEVAEVADAVEEEDPEESEPNMNRDAKTRRLSK